MSFRQPEHVTESLGSGHVRKTWIAAVSGAVLFTATACGGSAPGPTGNTGGGDEEITIGSLHPMSGPFAADGTQMDNGAKLAVEAVNEAGGISSLGGAKLALSTGDTQGKPEIGQSEAQRLIQGGAVALVGTYQSSVSMNVAAVAERGQVPFVMDITADDAVLDQGYEYGFRLQPPNSSMGTRGARYLKEISEAAGKPLPKVAYLHEQTAFGTSVHKSFAEEAAKLGIPIVAEISYDAATVSDLTTQITTVKGSGANVLVVTGYYRDSVLAARAVEAVKPTLDAVFGVADGAYDLPQFPAETGAAGEGYYDVNYRLDMSKKETADLAKLYEDRFGDEIRTGAVLAYDAVRVIAEALEKSGDRDPKKLRDAIAGVSLDPLVVSNGPVEFDDTGENVNALPVVMQVQDGEVTVVHPKDRADGEPRYPAGT
jgi:branched-chain amino acid transport system substrate-binding protein